MTLPAPSAVGADQAVAAPGRASSSSDQVTKAEVAVSGSTVTFVGATTCNDVTVCDVADRTTCINSFERRLLARLDAHSLYTQCRL